MYACIYYVYIHTYSNSIWPLQLIYSLLDTFVVLIKNLTSNESTCLSPLAAELQSGLLKNPALVNLSDTNQWEELECALRSHGSRMSDYVAKETGSLVCFYSGPGWRMQMFVIVSEMLFSWLLKIHLEYYLVNFSKI